MDTVVVTPGRGERADRGAGRLLEIVVDSAASGGSLAVVLCGSPDGAAGPPLHRHPGSDESMWVLAGTLLVHADGRTHRVPSGGFVFVPRGTAHTFVAAPGQDVRFLALHTPGGFEDFHRAVAGAEHQAGRELAPAELIDLAGRFDWAPAGPPLRPDGTLAVTSGPPQVGQQ